MNWYLKAFQQYAVFEGRAHRTEFWMFVLFNLIVAFVIGIIGGLIGTSVLSNLYSLAVLVPSIALTARRLHDIGKSGWWQLIGLIPVVGWIIMIVFCATDSQPGANEFGPNPKGPGDGELENAPTL